MAQINNVLTPGTKVTTNIGQINGTVLGICVRGERLDSIEYHIGYFVNGEYKTAWVFSYEVSEMIDNSKPTGFQSYSNKPLLGKAGNKP